MVASGIVRIVATRATTHAGKDRNRDDDSSARRANPPLKWAGGKRWLVPHIEPLWRPHHQRRYIEMFCGGLAVALGLQPERGVLNDLNPHLINFYAQLRRGLAMEIETRYDQKLFYAHRARFNELIKNGGARTVEAAQLFYYLNRTCFNGLCRFNQSGEFNVPFGQYKTVNYATDFHSYRKLFRGWSFTNKDLAQLSIESDDFIYADPPYDVEFTTYSAGGFSWNDQVRTAELLARHRGPVLLSNQATRRIVSLYRSLKFDLRFLDAPRRISCNGNRETSREVLATKNLG
ncbi:MAG TPA: Dam family site-specific DNA-(adenine-N6)-methyltransferase [Pyrinomonadaceae bacterium]|nr:Dam family site-specific DNA-(adenine-N6)-methyltransferase [Pyrinomonadaceae bacterium]